MNNLNGITPTQYKPFDGDYTDANYTKLLDDIQTEQGIDIGTWSEICVTLTKNNLIFITCSNDEGDEWVFDYTFPIPVSWDVGTVQAMFNGNVYLHKEQEVIQGDSQKAEK